MANENKAKAKYSLFIDECGDHNLSKYDPMFPIFTLCGILVSRQKLCALKKEDNKLLNYYNGLRNRGTKWVDAERLRSRISSFNFNHKSDNIIGLQIADLIAYPITMHFLYPERTNRSYDVVKHNIFSDKGVLLGQKVIPH